MEFNPNNHIVKRCIEGMALEEKGEAEKAGNVFLQAWNEASNDHEKIYCCLLCVPAPEKILLTNYNGSTLLCSLF